ncbi:MAG TPA: YIP1 family protein [Terriglobales bacterium]|nr:YIP1 family protein [Terriglobales bacterium]
MTSAPVTPTPETTALSEPARIIDTFIAPSKTFTDIRRSAAWWGPFLITVILSLVFVYAVDTKIGFRKVTENQIERSPRASQRMDQMPRDARNNALATQAKITRSISYGFALFILLWNLIVSAVLFGTFRLVLSADLSFAATFAGIMYAGLPQSLRSLVVIGSLFAGLNPDSFNLQNPVATNPGFFLNPADSPFLYSLGSSLDLFMIWTLILTAVGISSIDKKVKLSTALIVVFSWYVVFALGSAALATAFS